MNEHVSIVLPFKTLEAYGGFAECSGMLSFDGTALSLEFQTKDALVGFFKTGVKICRLYPYDLFNIEFKKGFISSKLTIQPASLSKLNDFPAATDGKIVLKLSKEYADLAMELVSRIKLAIAEYKLGQAERS